MAEPSVPGRYCPADYGLGPRAFGAVEPVEADVLYVVGGLYGNTVALDALLELFDRERSPRKRIVFNGDFHWFDRDPQQFARVERSTGSHVRLRGNVETEIAREGDGQEAGCGCAYPDEVDDGTVERSNRILAALRQGARASGADRALGRLATIATARVGRCRVAITHGDDRSLAGWRLAHDRIAESWGDGLEAFLTEIGADAIASSHTCTPVASTHRARVGTLAAINNGAAGMANFAGSHHGLFTRIAVRDAPLPRGARRLYGAAIREVDVAAIALDFDLAPWVEIFLRQWPQGSDAHRSYFERIVHGPSTSVDDVARGAFARQQAARAA